MPRGHDSSLLEPGEQQPTHLVDEPQSPVRRVDNRGDGVTDSIARAGDRDADVSNDSPAVAGADTEQSKRPHLSNEPVLVVEALLAVGFPVAATDARDQRCRVRLAEWADLRTGTAMMSVGHLGRSPCKRASNVSPTAMRAAPGVGDAAISRHAALSRAPIIRARRSGGTGPMTPLRTAASITGTSAVSAIFAVSRSSSRTPSTAAASRSTTRW